MTLWTLWTRSLSCVEQCVSSTTIGSADRERETEKERVSLPFARDLRQLKVARNHSCRWKFLLDSASVSTLLCTRNGGCHYFLNMFFNILVAGRPCFILLLYIRCCVRATEGESLLSDHVRQGKVGRWDGQSSAPVRTYQCLCVRFSVCAQRPV